MDLFTTAPLIARDHVRGIWAEGDHGASADDKETFRLAVSDFGFLVAPNERLTGAQLMRRIRNTYSAEEPRTRAVLEAINRVMLVPKFRDDHVLFSPYGQPVFRGRLAHCQVHARALGATDRRWNDAAIRLATDVEAAQCEAADVALANLRLDGPKLVWGDAARRHDAHPTSFTLYERHPLQTRLPPGYRLMVADHYLMWHAQLRKLAMPMQSGPAADGGQLHEEDTELALQLTATLARLAGYEAVVTYAVRQMPRAGAGSIPAGEHFTVDAVRQSLTTFLDSLRGEDWDASVPVFLVRPAPLVNGAAAVQPFEEMVHSQLIGWRIPEQLVQQLVDSLPQRSAERDRG